MSLDPPTNVTPPLRLRDTLSLIVGIVIGSAIYVFPVGVAFNAESTPRMLGIWLFAGALSTIGAMCYAELASADPRSGGDFNYISAAYGRRFGLIYGWMQLSVIIPGNIAAMSFVFAEHVGHFWPSVPQFILSLLAVASLAAINLAGTVTSKHTQNALTILKVAGLSLILLAGCLASAPTIPAGNAQTAVAVQAETGAEQAAETESFAPSLALALILAMYAYGGWSEAAYVAAEVHDARRNVPRALVLGMGCITVIYLLINLAYVHGLGLDGLKNSHTPASDLVVHSFGTGAGNWMNALVAVSALGAMQGMIFAGSRLVSVVGQGHALLSALGRLNARRSPVWAIVVLTGIACLAIVAFGTDVVRDSIRVALQRITGEQLEWEAPGNALETLVAAMAPIVWVYFALGGLTLIVLRQRHGSQRAPVKVPGYPVTPIIFCLTCLWMGSNAVPFAGNMTLLGLVPMLIGLPFVLGRRESSDGG